MILCLLALAFEASVGYPAALFRAIGHPVTWIGALIGAVDARFNRDDDPPGRRRAKGVAGLVVVLGVCVALTALLQAAATAALPFGIATVGLALIGSSLVAQRSLDQHVCAVAEALRTDGLEDGRTAVAMIVGRDTRSLDEAGVARAAIESLAENFADGIVAPALWLALLGLPGGVAYKAINTADSMIGHRTPRHDAFGYAAAKLDDIVNWPAARFAALLLVLAAALAPGASARGALRITRRDSRGHASPNAGWPEAAMAGALSIRLGGPRLYAGRRVEDATIGDGTGEVGAGTIDAALRLYRIACGLNIVFVALAALVIARWR